jgi:predicted RNA binding protein YcfA (HicA-like mRNA interferase family)
MNSREIIKILEKEGWQLVATKGSHNQYKHPTKKRTRYSSASKQGFS